MDGDENEMVIGTQEPKETPTAQTSWKPRTNEIVVLAILALISLMAALDATVLVTILPDISHRLHGSTTEAFWAGTSYLLTSAVSQPVFAMMTMLFGACVLTMAALAVFATGSIVCATAASFSILLIGRFVQGVGGGGIIALVQIICADMIPLQQRPQWFSLILLAWAIGTIAGPFLGSSLVQVKSFRLVFWINLPFCGIGLLILPFVMRNGKGHAFTLEKLSKVDWVGSCLFILSTTGFLLGLSWAGIQFSWDSAPTLVPVIGGVCGLIVLVVWERDFAQLPFFRPSLFESRSLCAAYFGTFLQGMILFCVLYYVPFYFAAAQLQSPMWSAVSILPISCSMLPVSVLTSLAISRGRKFRWAIWIGWFFTVIGAGHLPLLNHETSMPRSIITFIVFGLGMGMTLTSMNFGIQAMVNQEDAPMAASMYSFIRSLGMAVGVAAGGNVFQNVMSNSLRGKGLSNNIATDAERYISVLKGMQDISERDKITDSYVDGFRAVFTVVAVISGIAWITGFLIRSYEIQGTYQNRAKTK